MGSQEERTPGKVADCGAEQARLQLADPVAPHSSIDKPGGTSGAGGWGREADCATQGCSSRK